jgi:hypothetical protein
LLANTLEDVIEFVSTLFIFAVNTLPGPTQLGEAIGTATSSPSTFTSINQQYSVLSQVT